MKKIFYIFIFVLLISSSAQAGITLFGMKGELWGKFNKDDKIMYVQGLVDGLAFSGFKIHGIEISTEISIDQYISAINEIYSDYKNSLIPAPFLFRIVTLELNGLQKEKIEEELIIYRKQFSNSK